MPRSRARAKEPRFLSVARIRNPQMNLLKTFRISMPILGLGAIFVFAPPSKAQESDPTIFDNYEAAPAPVKAKSQPSVAKPVAGHARTVRAAKETSTARLQPATNRQSQTAQPRSTTAAPPR